MKLRNWKTIHYMKNKTKGELSILIESNELQIKTVVLTYCFIDQHLVKIGQYMSFVGRLL